MKILASFLLVAMAAAPAVVMAEEELTYKQAMTKCKEEYKLADDGPLDYFLKYGDFQAGRENLKCFFFCLSHNLNTCDKDGNIIADKIKELARKNPDEKELQLYSAEPVIQKCIRAGTGTACDKAYEFSKCGLTLRAELEEAAKKEINKNKK